MATLRKPRDQCAPPSRRYQHRRRGDGALFSTALPHRLRDLPRTQIGMTSAQKTPCHAAFDPRR